jgi:AraC-like DNA-binding protein
MLLVVNGHKQIRVHQRSLSLDAGDILLVPAGASLWMGNFPDNQDSHYLALGFRFDQAAIRHFQQIYGASLQPEDLPAQWQARVPVSIVVALEQLLAGERLFTAGEQVLQHRQVELLLILAQAGLAGNILLAEHPSWKLRVSQLLLMDPSKSWQLRDVCPRLGVSESSLRRKLQEEQTGFREVLEEIRLASALAMLLESMLSIGQIAEAVGYQSQSRFGERFKRHFGMTPTELRRTLVV